jgi:predicted metalloprotease
MVTGKAGLLVMVVVMVAGYYGIDLTPLLTGQMEVSSGQSQVPAQRSSYQPSAQEQELAKLSSRVLKSTEEVWSAIFQKSGQAYSYPKMVLYSGSTPTACGYGQSAMGPFYCPGDKKLYIDLSFYEDMKTKLGGGGDFALGYVLAHEVGHHVQNELGIASQVQRAQQQAGSKAQANKLSVRMELQADCLAGVWGHYMQRQGVLEAGDLEKALKTAAAIGDDRLQKMSTGRVVPDSFTHGTSERRLYWFKRGFDSGEAGKCDTFSTNR